MRILIAYSTTEGQTRKIARFCADDLVRRGHSVEVTEAGDDPDLDLGAFDAAILAGSIHVGAYQKPLADFARMHAAGLSRIKTLFLSVSLAAAGDDTGDWKTLADIAARFAKDTGWTPGRVEQVAGAFRFTEYDFFKSWAMRLIAAQKHQTVDPHADREYTDWEKLVALLAEWAPSATRAATAPAVQPAA